VKESSGQGSRLKTRRVAPWSIVAALAIGVGGAQIVHNVRAGRYKGLAPVCRVDTTKSIVALSFDDGPDRTYTPRALDLLARSGARATFFVTGRNASLNPRLVGREVTAGMEIGDHTWSHSRFSGLTPTETLEEIRRARDELARHGAAVELFRAPFGRITPVQVRQVRGAGLTPVHWSLAVDKYVGRLGLDATEAATALAREIRPGDIVLAHDVPGGRHDIAMTALDSLLTKLRTRGIQVVAVGELLASGRPIEAGVRPWFWQSNLGCPRN
jgi:peptidoglycan-N-acetylglucosamine deacetylase